MQSAVLGLDIYILFLHTINVWGLYETFLVNYHSFFRGCVGGWVGGGGLGEGGGVLQYLLSLKCDLRYACWGRRG